MSKAIEKLIEPRAERKGRMCVSGTLTTVHRIAVWYKTGWSAEEISRRYANLPIAGVYAALAYYHVNQSEVESEIAADQAEESRLEVEWKKSREEVAA